MHTLEWEKSKNVKLIEAKLLLSKRIVLRYTAKCEWSPCFFTLADSYEYQSF